MELDDEKIIKEKDKKVALITGITGQDGSYLAELLLSKGYKVYGMIRRLSVPNLNNIEKIKNDIYLIDGDLADQASIINAIKGSCPDEIYNLGAQSFVATSWQQAELTCNITGQGALRVFEGARMMEDYTGKDIKIYQASSSEMYGNADEYPQDENTIMRPRSPYGVAKVFAHNMARVYRETYKMWISCGILFNHESERRGIEFVSQKIADGVARILLGIEKELRLGDVNAKRDWGYAPDYVNAMWLMLNKAKCPDNYVIATNQSHSVREFCTLAFDSVGLNWEMYTKFDNELVRPAEIFELQGNYSKASEELGWKPTTKFETLVKIMVANKLNDLKRKCALGMDLQS